MKYFFLVLCNVACLSAMNEAAVSCSTLEQEIENMDELYDANLLFEFKEYWQKFVEHKKATNRFRTYAFRNHQFTLEKQANEKECTLSKAAYDNLESLYWDCPAPGCTFYTDDKELYISHHKKHQK